MSVNWKPPYKVLFVNTRRDYLAIEQLNWSNLNSVVLCYSPTFLTSSSGKCDTQFVRAMKQEWETKDKIQNTGNRKETNLQKTKKFK